MLCSRCLSIGHHHGRGLCSRCWDHLKAHGGLDAYPTWGHRAALAEDYEDLLPVYGDAFPAIAARLKVAPGTLERSLYRSGFRVVRSERGTGRKVFGRGVD